MFDFNNMKRGRIKRRRGKYQHTKSLQKYNRNKVKATKPELTVQQILRELGISFTTEYKIETKFYDIYIPSKNLLIEVDGLYWHGQDVSYSKKNKIQKKAFKNDYIKDGIATKHGYKIIRIREDEISINNIKKLIYG